MKNSYSFKKKNTSEPDKMAFTSVLTKSAGALINISIMNQLKKKFHLNNHRYSLYISKIIEHIIQTPSLHIFINQLDLGLQDIEKAVSLYNKYNINKDKTRQLTKQQIDKIFSNRKIETEI